MILDISCICLTDSERKRKLEHVQTTGSSRTPPPTLVSLEKGSASPPPAPSSRSWFGPGWSRGSWSRGSWSRGKAVSRAGALDAASAVGAFQLDGMPLAGRRLGIPS